MTDIEAKARALVADVVAETRPDYTGSPWNSSTILNEALYRAIEQHEAFKQEVSDAVLSAMKVLLERIGLEKIGNNYLFGCQN